MIQAIGLTNELGKPIIKFAQTDERRKIITHVECGGNEEYIVKLLREYKDKHKYVEEENGTNKLSTR